MKNTVVYLIRHAETVAENGIRNTNEDVQAINEKEILSVDGEAQAKALSKNRELKKLAAVWSSGYTRAKGTAKYIAAVNHLAYDLDSDLGERKLGNLKELAAFMQGKATQDPAQAQLLDPTFRTSDGESAEQTKLRMNRFFAKILPDYAGKKVAVVSHGGSIKFFLLNWCTVDEDGKLLYQDQIINVTSPCLLKLTFRKTDLMSLEQLI